MNPGVMKEYDYKARDAAGRAVRGRLRAASERDAAKRIAKGGLFVLRLRPARKRWNLRRSVDRRFPVFFCRRLAVMLAAGVTVGESLRVLSGQARRGGDGDVIATLYRAVADGERLSDVMARLPWVFTPGIAAMVDAGEKSGSLDVLLSRLADSLEEDYAAREKLLTLMLYPCVLALAVAVAAGFLLAFVFPVLYRRESFRVRADRLLLRIPVFGALAAAAERRRVSGTLAVLLGSGVVIDQALLLVEGVAENAFFRREIRRAHAAVQKGCLLSDAFRDKGLLPPMLLELLETGEATGEMEQMLEKISEFCRLDLNTRAERIRALLPPLALLFLGGTVGFILFSAVLPLLDSMTAFM